MAKQNSNCKGKQNIKWARSWARPPNWHMGIQLNYES